MKFVEEGDGQWIEDGDYVPFPIDGATHFVRIRLSSGIVPGVAPEEALCGAEIPDWRADPTKYPIAGQVTCPDCRSKSEQSQD